MQLLVDMYIYIYRNNNTLVYGTNIFIVDSAYERFIKNIKPDLYKTNRSAYYRIVVGVCGSHLTDNWVENWIHTEGSLKAVFGFSLTRKV